MTKDEDFVFEGFEPANTTPVPDILFDILLSKLSGAEVKVLLYIIRRTWGFKKQTDAISLSQLQNGITTREGKVLDLGCGIKRRETICEALASLEKKKCIFSRKEKTSYKDNATTVYGIYFKQGVVSKPDYPQQEVTGGSFKTGLPVVSKPDQGSPVTGPGVVSKPDPQETVIQLDSYQETVIQGDTFGASIDSAALTQLQNENVSLKAQLEQVLSEIKNAHSPGGNNIPSDTPLTPAGNITPAQEPYVLDNATPAPLINATDGLTQESGVTASPQNEGQEIALQTQETLSSTQGVDESSNQATEQGASNVRTDNTSNSNHRMRDSHGDLVEGDPVHENQSPDIQPCTAVPAGNHPVTASNAGEGVQSQLVTSPIARSTTNNLLPVNDATNPPQSDTTPVQPAPQKSRGGRGKGKSKEKVTQTPLMEEEEPEVAPPQEPPVEMKWGTRKCQLLFDYWRGVPLLTDFKLMQASKSAKQLATYYTEDEVRLGKKRMDADDYYKKRSVDIMDVANNIQRYVKKKSHLSIVSTNTATQGEKLIASTEGSQYIVDELEEVANGYIAAMEG